jgi:alpha-beta hydrolase superfamily lysophospholipase
LQSARYNDRCKRGSQHIIRKVLFSTLKHSLRISVYGIIGAVLALVTVAVSHLNNRSDLSAWHTVHLDKEFTAKTGLSSFAEYLDLEEQLFRQLDDEIYAETEASTGNVINRFSKGSLSDPGRWPQNWNRSYELSQPSPQATVLLLHGLSDSPYSLRHLAQALHAQGNHILNLRLPGHGTAPSGLVWASWQDMAAAVHLAARHLQQQHPEVPLHIVGYSNGAALALLYELTALADSSLPRPDKLVLISPEIGVSSLARFARTQARLGRLLGLEKLGWNDISPEYDPFKYGSFAINAGNLSYEITHAIQGMITVAGEQGRLQDIAPILAFSSVVDATVEVNALVEHLFNRLPVGDHELVLFDINHSSGIEQLVSWSSEGLLQLLTQDPEHSYTLRLLSNRDTGSRQLALKSWPPGQTKPLVQATDLTWPDNIYSLTHVALPFPPGDTLYGGEPDGQSPGIELGTLALRGERGVLEIPAAQMLRLRWNPFYSYLEDHTLQFLLRN